MACKNRPVVTGNADPRMPAAPESRPKRFAPHWWYVSTWPPERATADYAAVATPQP